MREKEISDFRLLVHVAAVKALKSKADKRFFGGAASLFSVHCPIYVYS